MTSIRKEKNYDSDIHALLAYELAIEAQNLVRTMGAISALARNFHSVGRIIHTVRDATVRMDMAVRDAERDNE